MFYPLVPQASLRYCSRSGVVGGTISALIIHLLISVLVLIDVWNCRGTMKVLDERPQSNIATSDSANTIKSS